MAFTLLNDIYRYIRSDGSIGETIPSVQIDPTTNLPISGQSRAVIAGSVTRPADTAAYATGDLIANSTTAGSVTPIPLLVAKGANLPVGLSRIRLKVGDSAWKAGVIRVHLFRSSPTVAVGDNGALNASETYAFTESDYLGYADITLAQQTSDGLVKGFLAVATIAEPASGGQYIYALLEARTAVTPASAAVFTVSLEVMR